MPMFTYHWSWRVPCRRLEWMSRCQRSPFDANSSQFEVHFRRRVYITVHLSIYTHVDVIVYVLLFPITQITSIRVNTM